MSLEESTHSYTDKDGRTYQSMSKFLDLFTKKFDRETISAASAKKRGISQESVLQEWDQKRDDSINHGNRIHNALERFEKTTFILPEDEDLRPMILSVASDYSHYYRIYQEQCLYNTEHLIAGTCDKLLVCTSHAKSVIDIADYKTNLSKGIQFKNDYGQYMLGPLSHLQDCNYNKYALQLSGYAWLLQQQTGKKVGSLHIRFIPPHNPLAHYPIPVPYMKYEIESMLQWRKENATPIKKAYTESISKESVLAGFSLEEEEWEL